MCTLVYFKFNNFIKCLSTFNTFFQNKKKIEIGKKIKEVGKI